MGQNAQQVKRNYWELHPELVIQINRYKDKFVKYYKLIDTGEINPDIVCSEILHTHVDIKKDETLINYIDNNSARFGNSSGTVKKHRNNVGGVQKALKKSVSKIDTLAIDMLKRDNFIMEIAEAVRKCNLMDTTRKEYFKTLDLISRKALKKKYHNPFKDGGYMPNNTVAKVREGVTYDAVIDGLEGIETYKDIEAYLLWLYSFSLQGLDAVDIANIDESNIVNEYGEALSDKAITHFHPFGDLIGSKGTKHLSEKWYVRGVRAKSRGKIDGLFNMFPTLFIRDWLHYIMQITSPELVYKGNDRLRLFNTKTRNSKGNEVADSLNKISVWRDYLSRR